MTIDKLMVLLALAASLVLVTQASARLFPVIAAVAAAVETLLVGGGVSWVQTDSKNTVTAATVVTLIGAIQLAAALHLG